MRLIKIILCVIIFSFVCTSCVREKEKVRKVNFPTNNHAQYKAALSHLGLETFSLGSKWIESSNPHSNRSISIIAPYEEEVIVRNDHADAYFYDLQVKAGQVLSIKLDSLSNLDFKCFVDVFRIEMDTVASYDHIASIDSSGRIIEFEVIEDGEYLIRVQPELLNSARFTIHINVGASLLFPVSGRDKRAIGSLFGVPRDAGRRTHEGIDIFAKRHTPLVAVSDGQIRFAGYKDGSLGGNVIWMRDTQRNQTIYYAHLEEVLVDSASYVTKGDTIGTVGNSGNAQTTHPHLHFGIYKNGAVDPYPFVVDEKKKYRKLLAKSKWIGRLARSKHDGYLYKGGLKSRFKSELLKGEYFEVVGRTGAYYKVRLANNELAYVFYDNIEDMNRPIGSAQLDGIELLDSPIENSLAIKHNPVNTIKYLARTTGYVFVETEENLTGWIENPKS